MNTQLSRPENWQHQFKDLLNCAIDVAGSKHGLARELGVSYQTVLAWTRGASPRELSLQRLEAYYLERSEAKSD